MKDKKEPRGFKDAKEKAQKYIENKEKTQNLVDRAMQKANKNKGTLNKIWTELQALFRLVGAWVKGKYKDISWKSILICIAAIVYFVNPLDVLPDFIPFLGFLDDATVVGFVISSLKSEIEKFIAWEAGETAEIIS